MATCESACCRPNLISSHVTSRPSSQQMYRRKDIYLSVTCQLYDSNDVMLSRRQRMNGSTSWNRKSFSSRPQVRLQLRFHKKVVHTFVLFIRSRLAERRRKTELPSSRRPGHDLMVTLSFRPLLEDVSGRASCMRAISDKMAVASPWFFEASQTAARLSQSFEDTRCFLGNLTPLVIASVLTLRVLQNGAQSTRQGIANRSAAMQNLHHTSSVRRLGQRCGPNQNRLFKYRRHEGSSRESPRHSELVPHAQSSVQVTRPFA